MKLPLVLFCAVVACTAELDEEFVAEYVAKIKKISDECSAESKATDEDLKTVLGHRVPESHEGKCLLFCFHKHFRFQNDDGSLNKEEGLKTLEPLKEQDADLHGKIVKMIETCSEKASADSDPCVYAANLGECGVEEGKAMGLDEMLTIKD